MHHIEDIRDHFPPIVEEIAHVIGWEASIALIRHFGGLSLLVPVTDKNKHYRRLVGIIGEEQTLALCANFAGCNLYIPKCEKALKILRDKAFVIDVFCAIKEGFGKMEAIETLSREYNISARLGWQILAEHQKNK